MKSIIIALLTISMLFACKKESVEPIEPTQVYYRLAMQDIDSNYTYSVVEYVTVYEYLGEAPCDCIRHPEDKRCKSLPVALEYFTARVSGRNTYIEWKTTSEESIDHFVVEKSLDGYRYDAVTKAIKPKGPSIYRVLFIN